MINLFAMGLGFISGLYSWLEIGEKTVWGWKLIIFALAWAVTQTIVEFLFEGISTLITQKTWKRTKK